MHGPSLHLKFFWGTVPPVPPRSPPLCAGLYLHVAYRLCACIRGRPEGRNLPFGFARVGLYYYRAYRPTKLTHEYLSF